MHYYIYLTIKPEPLKKVLVLLFVFIRFNRNVFFIGLIAGYLSSLNATMNYRDGLNQIPINPEYITITAQLNSLSHALFPTNNLNFTLFTQDHGSIYQDSQPNIRLVSNEYLGFKLGEYWQLSVKLSRPYGELNAVGFDRQRYFVGKTYMVRGTLSLLSK